MSDLYTEAAVCNLGCESCQRRMCACAAVLARECASDARLHLTHKDLYKKGLDRVLERCNQMLKVSGLDGFMRPVEPAAEWRDIAVFNDGSGRAETYYSGAVRTIFEFRDALSIQLNWIMKHAETLAGLHWRVGYLKPEIEVSWQHYRGKRTSPEQVAALWPDAEWRRKARPYDKQEYDWVAEVDGVTVILECTEKEKPAPTLREGPIRISAARREGV